LLNLETQLLASLTIGTAFPNPVKFQKTNKNRKQSSNSENSRMPPTISEEE